MKKEIKKIEDNQIRDFMETIDGFTPEQIKACEVYSGHIVYFLRLFDIHNAGHLSDTTDRLKDLRDYSKKYLYTDLFEYILYMSTSELEEALVEIQNKYPEFYKTGKNGKVVYMLDLAEEKRHRDYMEHLKRLPFDDAPDIDTEDKDFIPF